MTAVVLRKSAPKRNILGHRLPSQCSDSDFIAEVVVVVLWMAV